MKATIGETDSSAVKGEIFWRNEDYVSIDNENGLLYIYASKEHTQVKEVINMTSPNFHCVKFEAEKGILPITKIVKTPTIKKHKWKDGSDMNLAKSSKVVSPKATCMNCLRILNRGKVDQ